MIMIMIIEHIFVREGKTLSKVIQLGSKIVFFVGDPYGSPLL